VKPLAVRVLLADGAVSSVGTGGLPCGLRHSLCPLRPWRAAFASSTAATLGMSGWLGLTPQGLAPARKRHASLGARTSSVQRRAADLPTASVCADDVRATRCPTRPLQCVVRAATVATSPKKAQTN
jgi:hypothetical protein